MKNNITTKLSFKDYEKKYRNYKKGLMSFTKKEVLEFDKQANTIGTNYVLNKNRWALIGDTYYEMPKKLSCRWFKGVSASRKLLACIIPLGVVGALGGGGYGVYYLLTNNSNEALIDASCRDYAEIIKDITEDNGNRIITIKEKGESTIVSIDVTINNHQCISDEYSYVKANKDNNWTITIYKETLKNHKGRIVIHPKVSSQFDGKVTATDWNEAINYLITLNANRNFKAVHSTSREITNYFEKGLDEKTVKTDATIYMKKYDYEFYKYEAGKWSEFQAKKSGFNFDDCIKDKDIKIDQYIDKYNEFTFNNGVYTKKTTSANTELTITFKFLSKNRISLFSINKDGSEEKFEFSDYGSISFDIPQFDPPTTTKKFKIKSISPELKEQIIAEGFLTENGSTYYYKNREVVFDNTDQRIENYSSSLKTQIDKDAEGGVDAIDIYLTENESSYYVFKDDAYSIDVGNIEGFNYNDLYQYTIGNNTNANNIVKGIGTDIEPSVFIYKTDIANDVFGTAEPSEIAAKISTIDLFNDAAAKLKAKNYSMLATIDDMFRMYTQHFDKNFVNDISGEKHLTKLDDKYEKFGRDAIDFNSKGYFASGAEAWGSTWYDQMKLAGNTFGFIGPKWFITDHMEKNASDASGHWKVCFAPLASFWGGSNLSISPKSDNIELAKQFLIDMFNPTNLEKAYDKCKTPNSKTLIDKYAKDSTKTYEYLGGQNPYGYFNEVANAAPSTVITKDKYQGKCSDIFIYDAFKGGILQGKNYDGCIGIFKNKVKSEFPEITIDE